MIKKILSVIKIMLVFDQYSFQ